MQRRMWTAEEKMISSLKAFKEIKAFQKYASSMAFHNHSITNWCDTFLEAGKSAFENGNKNKEKILEKK